ncbi:MAG: PBECR2 nuclease fold domain-containing protein [Lachnospiraceae bacterium]
MARNNAKQIGKLDQKVIDLLKLELKGGTPIWIGQSNIEHIKNRHPYEYDKYFGKIENILEEPDYIGINPKDRSISFVKEYRVDVEFIRVAVKVTTNKTCYAKTLHLLSTCNAEHYLKKGTLIKLDNKS